MAVLPQKDWGEAGMAISFLGRETCRPSHPQHEKCVMSPVCNYYNQQYAGNKNEIREQGNIPVSLELVRLLNMR